MSWNVKNGGEDPIQALSIVQNPAYTADFEPDASKEVSNMAQVTTKGIVRGVGLVVIALAVIAAIANDKCKTDVVLLWNGVKDVFVGFGRFIRDFVLWAGSVFK